MKELSIEEKAKRYDEVVERLKDFRFEYRFSAFGDVIEEKFPELQESEDERIRKLLIEAVLQVLQDQYCSNRGVSKEKVVAWLEKQGEQKSIDNLTPQEAMDIAVEKCFEQGEQKPADKVVPIFHEGDWLCENEPNNYARFIQILEIVNVQGKERYRISRDLHNDEDVVEFGFVEKYYHKFDIQDANDGDVLAAHECYVIFKEIDGLNIRCYCTYHYMGYNPSFYVDTLQNKTAFHPATKEQCDTLMKAVTDAGYTFDFEKKELKKIEQKPAWSEEDENMLQNILECLRHGWKKTPTDILNYENWLKSLRPQNRWKPSDEQMKALWNVYQGGKEQAELAILYNDLKKLRNEK